MNGLQKNDILQMPVSIKSWIILHRYLRETWDVDVFCKIIDDYHDDLPLCEVGDLFTKAEHMLDDRSFQYLLNHLFQKSQEINAYQSKNEEDTT